MVAVLKRKIKILQYNTKLMNINWFRQNVKTNYIRFIYHLEEGSMKNVCGPVLAYLENITDLEI